MSQPRGPWDDVPPPPPQARPDRRPVWLWLLFMAAVGGLVVALFRAFPEAVRDSDDRFRVVYALGFLVLLSAGAMRVRREAIGQHLRHLALWAGVVAVLALGVAYREELAGVPQHLRLAFSDHSAVLTGDHEIVIPQDDEGSFEVVGKVNGQRIVFILDTGATDTVLSPDDARLLGLDPEKLDYSAQAETANGTGYGAPYTAASLEVGPIRMTDFRMSINKAPMSRSLLGLSFLDRLESFQIRGRKLILHWKG